MVAIIRAEMEMELALCTIDFIFEEALPDICYGERKERKDCNGW